MIAMGEKMKVLLIAIALFNFGCSSVTLNQNENKAREKLGNEIKIKVKKYTLDNGLRVLLVENRHLPIFSFYSFYDVGAKFETPGITGAAHFLEHLMFKGAKKYGPGEFDKLIEGNGGSSNAYTTMDKTVYYENLPSEHIDLIIDLEADRMANLLLEKTSFESERMVILEERKFRYENKTGGKLYLKMMQEMFYGTPYGGSVIGDIKDLETVSRDQIQDYFKRFYAPNNCVIVIVGNFDTSKVLASIRDKYDSIPASTSIDKFKVERSMPTLYKHQAELKRTINLNGPTPTPQFMVAYKGEPLGTKKSFVMDILASIIGDGKSSYLNQTYVYSKKPVLSNIYSSNYTMAHSGSFYVGGELLKGVSLDKFRTNFQKDLRKICENSFSERELQKTKNQYLINYYAQLETNAGMASFLGQRESFYGDYNFYKKELEIYNNITLEEVKNACHEIFKEGENIFLSIWDKHSVKN